ncbi:MAG: Fic family protein [Bifidobacterium sp.]|nr:Fic family protein [Bifidobacterium sp.]
MPANPPQYRPLQLHNKAEVEAFVEFVISVHDLTVSEVGFHAGKDGDAEKAVSPSVYATFVSVRSSTFCDIFEQMAFFAEHLSKDHPFGDGNKRTTVKLLIGLIRSSGIKLDMFDSPNPEDNELYQWIQKLVTNKAEYLQLADFLRSRASMEQSSNQ